MYAKLTSINYTLLNFAYYLADQQLHTVVCQLQKIGTGDENTKKDKKSDTPKTKEKFLKTFESLAAKEKITERQQKKTSLLKLPCKKQTERNLKKNRKAMKRSFEIKIMPRFFVV